VSEAREARRAVGAFVVRPFVLLTVALLGGLRIGPQGAFVFVAPPLVSLVLGALLLALCVQSGLARPGRWLSSEHPLAVSAAHAVTLAALFFASVQAINSVLPERGLLHGLVALFLLWTLWNDQFAPFDGTRLLRRLVALFGTAFLLKHVLLAGMGGGPSPSWSRRLVTSLLDGVTLGSVDLPALGPATGYVSFFTLALYLGGLALLHEDDSDQRLAVATRAANERPNAEG
jgi:hypothetical protein